MCLDAHVYCDDFVCSEAKQNMYIHVDNSTGNPEIDGRSVFICHVINKSSTFPDDVPQNFQAHRFYRSTCGFKSTMNNHINVMHTFLAWFE